MALITCLCGPSFACGATLPATGAKGSRVAAAMQFDRRHAQTPEEAQLERDRVKALNKDRQQKLKNDTDKLLQLATELKEYVDKTNENILSVDVIKKTDEIEKLAKSVREKMKTFYQVDEESPLRPR
jgi:hypothetical protein